MRKFLISLLLILFIFSFGCSSLKISEKNIYPKAKTTNYLNLEWEYISLYAPTNERGERRDARSFFDLKTEYESSTNPITLNNKIYFDIKYQRDCYTDSSGEIIHIDSWQKASQTFEKKTGDCEDHAILLTSILLSRGYDAYLVVGGTEGTDTINHSWVYLKYNGKEYFLDPTNILRGLEYNYYNYYANYRVYCIINDKAVYKNKSWAGRNYSLTKEPTYQY